MNELSKDVLFLLSKDLNISDLLNFSKCSKRIYEKVFLDNSVWLYKLEDEFYDFSEFELNFKGDFKEIYKFLFSLRRVKYALEYDENLTLLELYKFENLSIREEGFNRLPKDLGILINLRELDLSSNQLEEIPPLENLINLQKLNMSGNGLKYFSLENLIDLEEIRLDNNRLKSLSLTNLINLKKLTLHANKLEESPSLNLPNLPNLEYLTLSINKLNKISDSLGDFSKLKCLYLNHNELLEIPSSIGNLLNLEILTLNNNQLTEIPSTLEKLVNLKHIDFSNNDISYIPPSLNNLKTDF